MNQVNWILLCCVSFSWCVAEPSVRVDFFYEPGCHACEKMEADLFPMLEERFPGVCEIYPHDIGIETNFLYLLQLEDHLGYDGPERAYLIVNRRYVFGSELSPEPFFSLIDRLQSVLEAENVQPSEKMFGQAERRFDEFTWGAVLAAGLIDGLNPCAISTLVFFMSLLAVSKIRQRKLLLLGVSYCLASFCTYLAIGFGLFRLLHLLSGFATLRNTMEWMMALVLLVLAGLSFRDALRYRQSGKAADVSLQLSAGMKKKIHHVMRRGLGFTSILLGGLLIGTAVTALESVCTGQVYVPTLVLILKNSAFSEWRAWFYLLVYNLMFILPLVVVFIAVYFGLKTEALLQWNRRNLAFSKILLGLFFAAMAILIFWI